MLQGTLIPRTLEVPGLGSFSRSWFSDREAKWRGRSGAITLRLPGGRKGPDPASETYARDLLPRLVEAPMQEALRTTFKESDAPGAVGPALWLELDIWPYGRTRAGALAVFQVPWDEEHVWAVLLNDAGAVQDVIVSP
jgi:hypothetical protein